ncbi:MAG: signal peptidase I [Oscillospiraceae bacterium]|nr:signal peptidase I [Oscillospiraceae bacterium]
MRAKKRKIIVLAAFTLFLAILLIIRQFLGFIFVQGISMEPTYQSGDLLFINKATDSYRVDDVIVFEESGTLYVKRIIGAPGDQIELVNGCVYRNGMKLSQYWCEQDKEIISLNENQFFVIGDNFQNSIDSRDFGPVELCQIDGRVFRYSNN